VTFSLRTYNVSNSSTTQIGTFPNDFWGGWDSIFRFDGVEVWAAFPKKPDIFGNIDSGELFIMDGTSGAIKKRQEFPKHGGEPYYTLPAAEDGTFGAVFSHNGGTQLSFCTCDPSGKKITTSGCVDASDWWDIGEPPTVCPDGTIIVAPKAMLSGNTQPVFRVVPETGGSLAHVMDIVGVSDVYKAETMACIAA